jgi:hypothetical protein
MQSDYDIILNRAAPAGRVSLGGGYMMMITSEYAIKNKQKITTYRYKEQRKDE